MLASDKQFRVVAVCLGNICRSPIAEAVLAKYFDDAGMGEDVTVESAGTAGYHVGQDADRRTRSALARAGYRLNHSARQYNEAEFGDADLILGMDLSNIADLLATSTATTASRIRALRSFDPELAGAAENDLRLEVPDPYYGDARDFDLVIEMVEAAAPGVVSYVQDQIGEATN